MRADRLGEDVVKWGVGQSPEMVEKTNQRARGLTPEQVEEMIRDGLTREWVEQQLDLYRKALAAGGAKLRNAQLIPRLSLIEAILRLWP